ncbi:radical SAM family heme chaperone HemW [Ruegeria arenilitoris]|uniref:Heme chaperone HemW n=1 Tax=Ruegeria arenilitoris TaxID=1173585 RepID=A0A238KN79_9RHOB|nr:radical SAM family heme chaperone HemW [Ruegeria arenilitoris]SMX44120.1 Oxygen-independent coproporphyrinogen-III oxidase 1 [Ruegeria arenilitoris]
MADDWRNGGFGLYVHWPFCEAKCPYCDFNSHVSRNIDQKQWLDAYLSELKRSATETPDRVLNTIFFGGGTPSLMAPETVAAVIDTARSLWRPSNDMEITLEANPGSVEAGRFAAYRDAGVNRISMGIQAMNDEDLRRLGRIHSVAEARAAFDIARTCFDRVSFDLIYARQYQTLEAWRAELTEALSMAIDHLSLYQLTIEAGTAFGDRYSVGKLRGLPEDDNAADMYVATQEVCEAHGMPAYEVSNHAVPGAESRHNLIYWRYGDYVGIGPGAHGRITVDGQRIATETHLAPNAWLNAAEQGNGEKLRTPLTDEEQANEYLMMCLRLTEGLDMDRFNRLSGHPLPQPKLDYLQDIGMIAQDGPRVSATADGRAVLNAVIRELLD